MVVTARSAGDAVVAAYDGRLDAQTVRELHRDVVRLVAGSAFRIVLDLSGAVPAAPLPDLLADLRRDVEGRVRPYRGWLRVVAPPGADTSALPPGTFPTLDAALAA